MYTVNKDYLYFKIILRKVYKACFKIGKHDYK